MGNFRVAAAIGGVVRKNDPDDSVNRLASDRTPKAVSLNTTATAGKDFTKRSVYATSAVIKWADFDDEVVFMSSSFASSPQKR